ncbi:MAG: hypothetical protein AAFX79_11815 [Planctomycetota bacterium]
MARKHGDEAWRHLTRRLRHVRGSLRRLLVLRLVGWLVAAVVAAIILVVLGDYALRLPAWARTALWIGGLAAIGFVVARRIAPAVRVRPALSDLALRIEAREPGLRGRLASAVDLGRGGDAARAADLLEKVDQAALPDLLRRRPAYAAAATAIALLLLGGAMVAARPGGAQLGLTRVLAPWAGAQWPSRTAIAIASIPEHHPLGAPLAIQGLLTRTDEAEGRTRVFAWYSVEGDSPTRVALTSQGAQDDGELFERLVQPAVDAPRSTQSVAVDVWLETKDDRTEPARVLLVRPPAVVEGSATARAPAYAAQATGGSVLGLGGSAESTPLEFGVEAAAAVGPLLAASTVEVGVRFSKPATLRLANAPEGVDVRPHDDGLGATLALAPEAPVTILAELADEFGIASTRPVSISLDVIADGAPAATVVSPARDEAVLATAVVDAAGEARDDVGLAMLRLEVQRLRPPIDSLGAPPEPDGEPATLAAADLIDAPREARAAAPLDLSALGLRAGDEVWLSAIAADLGAGDEIRSTPRKLRIIEEDELVEQLRGELAAIREAAKRIDAAQQELIEAAATGEDAERLADEQAELTQRLARQAADLQGITRRAQRNGVDDAGLAELVSRAGDHLAEAATQSERAEAAQGAADEARDAGDERRAERGERDAERARERVRDELGDLVGLLSRDEDEWLARRDLERLIEQQRELREQTQELAAQTIGRSMDELTPEQRSAVERIAERQAELAERAQRAIDGLADQAEAVAERDPARARTLREAAERGREAEVPRELQQAAEEASRNQLSNTQQRQDAALDALEDVAERLDQAREDRDRELRRVLAELADAIERLVRRQQIELDRLAAAQASGSFIGLDAAMIGLSRDTAALAVEQAAPYEGLQSVERLLLDAADAQDEAVAALRGAPLDDAAAVEAETRALELLRSALAEAQRLEEEARQRDLERQRLALRRAYAAALQAQTALRDESATFVDRELTRKQRILVRRLGDRQRSIRADLATTRAETEGLDEAAAFSLAHDRIDRAADASAEDLEGGAADAGTLRSQQTIIVVLRSLIEALDSASTPSENEFDRAAQGGQGGEQTGDQGEDGVVPPLAELLLLRAMQAEAADLTRAIDEGQADADLIGEAGQLQQELSDAAADLVRRMSAPGGAAPQPQTPAGWEGLGFAATVAARMQDQPATDPQQGGEPSHDDPPQDDPPRDDPPRDDPEDDLLDLFGEPSSVAPDGDLDRALGGAAGGAFERAVDLMQRAAQQLNDERATGIATQRVQEDVLSTLDQLIEDARNRQNQQSSSSQQQQQQQQQQQAPQQQQQQGEQGQQAAPSDPQGVNPQPQRGGNLLPQPASGAAWGALPPRVRDALRQSSSDSFSAVYRAITEAYYRRLAEEANR